MKRAMMPFMLIMSPTEDVVRPRPPVKVGMGERASWKKMGIR